MSQLLQVTAYNVLLMKFAGYQNSPGLDMGLEQHCL